MQAIWFLTPLLILALAGAELWYLRLCGLRRPD
jgi:hypothetical protein